jgi:hypothetical protein
MNNTDANIKKWTRVPLPLNANPSPTPTQKNDDVPLHVELGNVLAKVNVPVPILESTKFSPHMDKVKKLFNIDK